MSSTRQWSGIGALVLMATGAGCGADAATGNAPDEALPASTGVAMPSAPDAGADANVDADAPAVAPAGLELHFAFVNGLLDPANYTHGEGVLRDLEKSVLAAVHAQAPAFEAAHHVKLTATSVRLNVYTDLDGNVPTPGTDDGSGDEVAARWRSQLAKKLAAALPNGEKNIVLVGHSTGARAAMELAADVGGADNVLGGGHRGFRDRIAGVVSVHGMLDALSKYPSSAQIISFETGCKVEKKSGWCEYAANVSAWPAADWVAENRRSLVLTGSFDDCGFPLWAEDSDNALPLRAQGSPSSVGIGLAKTDGGSFSAAHGTRYGNFCHSDITNAPSPRHTTAVKSATDAIANWLFTSAPRVVNGAASAQSLTSLPLAGGTSSAVHALTATCPLGAVAVGAPSMVGNCSHPGLLDGDDHAMTAAQLVVTSNGACGGTVQWKNIHGDAHAGTVWFKSYAQDPAGGLLGVLAAGGT